MKAKTKNKNVNWIEICSACIIVIYIYYYYIHLKKYSLSLWFSLYLLFTYYVFNANKTIYKSTVYIYAEKCLLIKNNKNILVQKLKFSFSISFCFIIMNTQLATHTHTDLRSAAAVDQIRYELYQFTDNYNLLKV